LNGCHAADRGLDRRDVRELTQQGLALPAQLRHVGLTVVHALRSCFATNASSAVRDTRRLRFTRNDLISPAASSSNMVERPIPKTAAASSTEYASAGSVDARLAERVTGAPRRRAERRRDSRP